MFFSWLNVIIFEYHLKVILKYETITQFFLNIMFIEVKELTVIYNIKMKESSILNT